MDIHAMIDRVIAKEGGYSNHPSDRGGETMWGITEEVARAFGYTGPMKAMPRDEAVRIYKLRYWLRPGFDNVAGVYSRVAEKMFDIGVNMGPQQATKFLQRALNALNHEGRLYGDLALDGDCGPLTVQNLAAFRRARGEEGEDVMLKAINCLQGERYIRIAESRPANEAFVYGWLRTRVA